MEPQKEAETVRSEKGLPQPCPLCSTVVKCMKLCTCLSRIGDMATPPIALLTPLAKALTLILETEFCKSAEFFEEFWKALYFGEYALPETVPLEFEALGETKGGLGSMAHLIASTTKLMEAITSGLPSETVIRHAEGIATELRAFGAL